jgi:hypothetical protein
MNRADFIKLVKGNAKSGQWLNGNYIVEGKQVGVKAFGLWVQACVIEGAPRFGGTMSHKTQSAMAAELDGYLSSYL